MEAADGSSALDILKADDHLDVLIADFAMPGMTGTDLACKAREVRPDVGILLVTTRRAHLSITVGFVLAFALRETVLLLG